MLRLYLLSVSVCKTATSIPKIPLHMLPYSRVTHDNKMYVYVQFLSINTICSRTSTSFVEISTSEWADRNSQIMDITPKGIYPSPAGAIR
ncbi:Hypothetical protein GSB_153104 [Giardia duodenalis]|uniref:Uncharacterized protein n=1 Tax=Giardia intestinalis TaxID=5741 RepID=V6TP82_GIAIN|nr:Hypothetical protein GSB_153104 [Giardia intestinalis]